jgi:hypothetical protein
MWLNPKRKNEKNQWIDQRTDRYSCVTQPGKPTAKEPQILQGVSQNMAKQGSGNLQIQALNNLVQLTPSKKYYSGAEVPFSSGRYKASRAKPIKMGEFLSLNRAKRGGHNNSSLTEHHNLSQSREQSQLRRAGTQKDPLRASASSYTDRHKSKDPFEGYLRGRHHEKLALTDAEDNINTKELVQFDLGAHKTPQLVFEPDPDDVAGIAALRKRAKANESSEPEEPVEDSDGEIKFPFSKKADKGEKGKKVEFRKLPAIKNVKGRNRLIRYKKSQST